MSTDSKTNPLQTPSKPSTGKRDLTSPFDPNDSKRVRERSVDLDSPREHTDMSDSGATSNFRSEDFSQISALIQKSFQEQLPVMVKTIVDGVLQGINAKVSALENENASLKSRVCELETKLRNADSRQDRLEQYSRRNCLRLSGVTEADGESTDKLVMELASAIGSGLSLDEVDRCHRLGKPPPKEVSFSDIVSGITVAENSGAKSVRTKPRDIIIKFVSYRARNKMYSCKSKLKNTGYKGVFLNEDLTKSRSQLYYQSRVLAQRKLINSTWTSDGTIIIKSHANRYYRIESEKDFTSFKQEEGIRG